jgi:alpha-L-fucosidase
VIPQKNLDQFNPIEFDAEQWVSTAKDLGFRYIVLASKHHSGFCMFDSKLTDYDIIDATPFKRDPIKELADACAGHDMLFGAYYSVWDLHHPDYSAHPGSADYAKYHQYMLDQSKELLTNYGPLVTLWLDGEWVESWTVERALDYGNHLRQWQPNILLVDRIGQRRVGDGDYGSSENFVPYIGDMDRPWESCQKFDGSWFFNGKTESQSVGWALYNLAYSASRGGNFLMNMGPTPQGTLLPSSVATLKPLGAWLRVNGESIYGVDKGPHHMLEWGTCSRRRNTLYYTIFDWPADGKLAIPGLNKNRENAGIRTVRFLADEHRKSLPFSRAGDDIQIDLPASPPYALANVLEVKLDNPPMVDNAIRALTTPLRKQTGTPGVKVGGYFLSSAFAEIRGDKLRFSLGSGAGAQRENLKGWMDGNDWAGWEIAADKPGRYAVNVTYSSWMESGAFSLEIAGETFQHKVQSNKPGRKKSPLAKVFRTVTVGEATLDKPGRYTLTVRPLDIAEKAKDYHQGLMLLAHVVLDPLPNRNESIKPLTVTCTRSSADGIGAQKGVMRRGLFLSRVEQRSKSTRRHHRTLGSFGHLAAQHSHQVPATASPKPPILKRPRPATLAPKHLCSPPPMSGGASSRAAVV